MTGSIALTQLVAAAIEAGLDAARPATVSERIAAERAARAAVLHVMDGAGVEDLVGELGEAPAGVEVAGIDTRKANDNAFSCNSVPPGFEATTLSLLVQEGGDNALRERIVRLQAERAAAGRRQ